MIATGDQSIDRAWCALKDVQVKATTGKKNVHQEPAVARRDVGKPRSAKSKIAVPRVAKPKPVKLKSRDTQLPEVTTTSRDKLLQTAVQQFARFGFDGVSTGDIAAAAGYSQAIIHYHFGSKDQLWKDALTYLMHDLDARFPLDLNELSDLQPIDRLRVIVRRFIAMSGYSTDLTSILIREALADSDRLEWLVKRHFQKRIDVLDNIIKAAIDSGKAKDLPTFVVTQGILMSSSVLFCLSPLIKLAYGVDLKDRQSAAMVPDALLELFLTGLARQ